MRMPLGWHQKLVFKLVTGVNGQVMICFKLDPQPGDVCPLSTIKRRHAPVWRLSPGADAPAGQLYFDAAPMIRMVTMDKLIANAERIATTTTTTAAAERAGLDDVAAASRDNIRRYRELRDDFRCEYFVKAVRVGL